MNLQEALNRVVDRKDLSQDEATEIAGILMRGEATQAQIGGFLVALRMKGETVDEIAGFVRAMRDNATRCPVQVEVVDIVGTGGDHSGTFNISTTTAFVVAGAGGKVAKHGNRSISSRSGAADVLAHLGLSLELSPEQVAHCVERAGVGFLFAQAFHPAMKHVGPARREMGVRTVFNLLGPLTNPAGTKRLVVGVYDRKWCRPLAEALSKLGTEQAWVVHGSDGLDEITTTGPTFVASWDGKSVKEFEITPEQAGLGRAQAHELLGGEAAENAVILRQILSGLKGPKRDIVVLNAAAALVVAGLAVDLAEGVSKAQASIDTGAATAALDTLFGKLQGIPTMSGILAKIAGAKKVQLHSRKRTLPEDELEKMALLSPAPAYPLQEYLRRRPDQPIRVLAECKKASPSRGVMIADYDPLKLARQYLGGGASAISVLTETEFFLGDDAHLRTVTGTIPLPVLRKDFTLERYQILEARCLGASAILLIAALLNKQELADLTAAATEMCLDTLIEVHSEWELEAALAANPSVVGINNRNLDTFEVSLETTFDLLPGMPKDKVIISESGIFHREQCQRLEEAGVDAILIGEGVGTSANPADKIRELQGLPPLP